MLFSPESLQIIKEGPQGRRDFIDDVITVLNPQNSETIELFRKTLKARNKLLKNIKVKRQNGQSVTNDYLHLETLSSIFIEFSIQMIRLRIDTLNLLKPQVSRKLEAITDGAMSEFSFRYIISGKAVQNESIDFIKETLHQRLAELKDAELALGQSLVGPQRHEIEFISQGKESRNYTSQGQQRALILALKMAQIEAYAQEQGDTPLLLFDDVMSELDVVRQKALTRVMTEFSTQSLITATDATPVQNQAGLKTVWKVKENNLKKMNAGDDSLWIER